MNNIVVSGNKLRFGNKIYTCAIGKNGFSANKLEGDNCTPLGIFPLRKIFYLYNKPETSLPCSKITEFDGWCDDVTHEKYNQHIVLPNPARHEKLLRKDGLYNYIIVIGYNDNPIIKGKGSAIFMHIARQNYEGTEGCIALSEPDILEIIKNITPHTLIEIKE